MTDTDDVALLELQVAVLLILQFALLLKIHLRFRGSFLRFHSMADWLRIPIRYGYTRERSRTISVMSGLADMTTRPNRQRTMNPLLPSPQPVRSCSGQAPHAHTISHHRRWKLTGSQLSLSNGAAAGNQRKVPQIARARRLLGTADRDRFRSAAPSWRRQPEILQMGEDTLPRGIRISIQYKVAGLQGIPHAKKHRCENVLRFYSRHVFYVF